MTIVVPYRLAHDGIELKFMLRSIEKNLTGYNEVVIVGDKLPSWITNIKHLPRHEETDKSSRNIINKLLHASHELREDFIRWDDDIYLNSKLGVKDFKYWFSGTLADAIKDHRNNVRYRKYIENTAFKITDSALFYDIHTPMIYEWRKMDFVRHYDWSTNYLSKSLYCHHAGVIGEGVEDCKIRAAADEKETRELIDGKLFFCTGPQTMCPLVNDILTELYPNKSKYET